MAGHFWDTSALVKHYHPELGTAKVDTLLQTPGCQQVLSRLAVTETFSVFAGKVRAGLVAQPDFDKLCSRFLADTRGKLFSVARLLVAHHKEAERQRGRKIASQSWSQARPRNSDARRASPRRCCGSAKQRCHRHGHLVRRTLTCCCPSGRFLDR